jgi:hypothetical protein
MTVAQLKDFAKWAVESRKFKNIRSPQTAMILIQFGRELGFGPATSLQAVYEVNGTPALKANTIAARIKEVPWPQDSRKSRYDYRVIERTATVCVLEFFERNDEGVMESRGRIDYTLADAKLSKDYDRNPNYKTRPKNMLFSRCLTEGARVFCPNCLGGIVPYTPDELGAQTDEDGAPIEDADFEVSSDASEGEGIADEEYAEIRIAADAKQLCLADVIAGLGGDPNDLRGMTRGQYTQACTIIDAK